jgi:hypothetical protein
MPEIFGTPIFNQNPSLAHLPNTPDHCFRSPKAVELFKKADTSEDHLHFSLRVLPSLDLVQEVTTPRRLNVYQEVDNLEKYVYTMKKN